MSLEDFRQVRIEKLENIKKSGEDPFPAKSWRTHTVKQALDGFADFAESRRLLVLTGRMMARREHGGSAFFDLQDDSGNIQLFLKKDVIGEKDFEFFIKNFDVGDFIEVNGFLFSTKQNEPTLQIEKFRLLAKAILPLPEKWHGLEDEEERLRKRYVDLIMRPEQRDMFVQKSRFWQSARQFLLNEGGLEVETPILSHIPGGADAEPFVTRMNALDMSLYLRISPELSLKRLMVAGYEKVFEIGRIFRNEGIDREHLQDYTQMEMYWAYTDYEGLMKLVEKLFKHIIQETLGSLVHSYQDKKINWGEEWKIYDYYEIFRKYTGIDLDLVDEDGLIQYGKSENIDVGQHVGKGRLIDVIFKKKVRPHLEDPGFLILPPVDIEPLAKRWLKDKNRVERFQIVAGGTELGKGFSELNDPIDQRARFEEQMKLREGGDKEAQLMDDDFVEALEQGMPPTAGFGYSERLFSFIVDKPVRETVFFPLMKDRIQ